MGAGYRCAGEVEAGAARSKGVGAGLCLIPYLGVLPERKDTISVAFMESNFQEPSHDEAKNALTELSADRNRLTAGISVPWMLLAAFGAVAAGWVGSAATASPGENYQPALTPLCLGLAIALVILYLLQRETGIKFRSLGSRGNVAMVGIVLSCMTLFSVSLGLVSVGWQWAVIIPAVLAFAVTIWLAAVAYRSAIENLRRG